MGTVSATASRSKYRLKEVEELTHPAAAAFYKMAYDITEELDEHQAFKGYQITGDAKRPNESVKARYERVLRRAMHHDFPITGNDGGYSLKTFAKPVSKSEVSKALSKLTFGLDPDVHNAKVKKAVMKALDAGLIVIAGKGQGNNTLADIVAVADPKNQQFAYLISSNFGSDS